MKFSFISITGLTIVLMCWQALSSEAAVAYSQDCHLLSSADQCCDVASACFQLGDSNGQATIGLGACTQDYACSYAAKDSGFASIADHACTSMKACQSIGYSSGHAEVGSYSCSAQDSCKGSAQNGKLVVGEASCTADTACGYAARTNGDLTIGDNSCTFGWTCAWASSDPSRFFQNYPQNQIGSNSCTAPDACTLVAQYGGDVVIGDYSCTNTWSCRQAAALDYSAQSPLQPKLRIGSHSCSAWYACDRVASNGGDVTIGDYSCTGMRSCQAVGSTSPGNQPKIQIGSNSCTCERCCECLQDGDIVPDNSCHNLGECCNSDRSRNGDFLAALRASANGGAGGDPHITTWNKEHYEYHGQCDLVMMKDPNFAEGLGLDIHIRTKIVRFWSYIKTIAIKIGNDILEIEGSANAEDSEPHYWINYEYQGELDTAGGFPVTQKLPSSFKRQYIIDLGPKYPGQSIVVQLYKEFVRVKFSGTEQVFGNTVGLLGDYKTGQTFARDGVTIVNDFTELGDEWQVLPSDGKLFRQVAHPQFPELCIKPEDPRGDRKRRLAETNITVEEAEVACSSLKDPLSVKDCVYDVLATQDIGMVGAF